MNDFGPKRPMSEDAPCALEGTEKRSAADRRKNRLWPRKGNWSLSSQGGGTFRWTLRWQNRTIWRCSKRPRGVNTTSLRVRKMLITAGVYSMRLSRKVQSLYEDGCSIQQIMDETGLKKSSVHGYLPYIKGNYNLPEVTLDAEYSRVYRKRISVCEWLRREIDSPDAEEYLWDAIVAYVDYSFITEKGLSLKYAVQGGEIFFNRKKKSVTRATVMKAFHRARQLQHEKGFVSGPKELGIFGASYIYQYFFGLACA